jgi:hypothetical protein
LSQKLGRSCGNAHDVLATQDALIALFYAIRCFTHPCANRLGIVSLI